MMSPSENPARLGGLIIGVVSAVLVLLVAFGVEITSGQQQAIIGVVGSLISLCAAVGVGELVERRVTSLKKPKTAAGEPAMLVKTTGHLIDGGE